MQFTYFLYSLFISLINKYLLLQLNQFYLLHPSICLYSIHLFFQACNVMMTDTHMAYSLHTPKGVMRNCSLTTFLFPATFQLVRLQLPMYLSPYHEETLQMSKKVYLVYPLYHRTSRMRRRQADLELV